RASRTASVSSSGSGQVRPDRSQRRNISRSVEGATPVRLATSRVASPASRLNLNISRTRRMAILSVGIGPSKRRQPKASEDPHPWAASSRNAARGLIGTVGGIKSEWWAASNRNDGRDHVGIRNHGGSDGSVGADGAEDVGGDVAV